MPYSKAFRKGLQDALEKARWRMEVHFKSHFQPEERPATLGDLYKSFVVMHDCLENLIAEIVNYLEPEVAKAKAREATARPRRRPGTRKTTRRSTRSR